MSPSITGSGSAVGQDRDSLRPARSSVISGCFFPPPENAMPTVAALGAMLPSARFSSAVSIAFQASSTRARTGRRCSTASKSPFGRAYVSLVSPRSEVISTFFFERSA